MSIKWEHRYEQLSHLPEAQLLSLARNESAPMEFRLFALELMKKQGFLSAKHPDLKGLVALSGKVEIEEIDPEEYPIAPENTLSGAPSASVTTQTMFQDYLVVQNTDDTPEITPANEAPISNKKLDKKRK
jgi:hypothetical protein